MQLPFISVILPVRNEERYIAACVDSIFSQDYPADQMEVIFVDGRSEDRTVELLHAMQKEHPQIVVLDNPNRTVPYAMNIGIAHSSAPVIVRLDAHAEYPADYIRLSVETLLTKDCDNAGGVFETHGRGFMGEAIAEMLKTPLGVGNATYRLTTEDGYVDTVPFGCFKRALFERIGGFDERMTRNQDNELNFRIRKNGGKIYLNHNIRVQYYCRDTMRGIMKMGYMNGKWNVITMTLVPGSMGVRHFVPLAFVLSTILLVLLTLLTKSMLFGGLLAQIPLGRLSDLTDRRHVLFYICCALGFIVPAADILVIKGGWYLAALTMLLGACTFTLYPISVSHINDLVTDAQRVHISGMLILAQSIGLISGPIIVSAGMSLFGPDFFMVAFFIFPAAFIIFTMNRIWKKPDINYINVTPTAPMPTAPTHAFTDLATHDTLLDKAKDLFAEKKH